jgi:hypothetical protein
MITAKAIATVVAMVLVGSVLHRALAMRLLAFDGRRSTVPPIPERDLFLLGLLPGIALVGAIDTYLALFHLFRADVTAALGAGLLIWRRRDTMAIFQVLAGFVAELWFALRRIDAIALVAVWSLAVLLAGLFFLAQIPAETVDVWVFQLPLSISLADHSGFVYPQMNHAFYANNPLFFNLLFAQTFLFIDHYIAAVAVNIVIYVGFLLTLLTYARRGRALAFLVLLAFVAPFFTINAVVPLIDLPRTCFSVLSLVFADRYLREGRGYDIVMSGLLVGAAVAGKYTELVTMGLIGLCLLPRLLRERRTWLHLIGFGSAVLAVASYWYFKNWILLGNPIYPFLFAHPGLSDTWVADYMLEMSRAFEPADRVYVTNLLTVRGWRDFFFIVYRWFFLGHDVAQVAGILFLLGIVWSAVQVRMLAFCTVALFIVWYVIMFNSIRWAMPAYLLFFVSAFVVWTRLYDLIASQWTRTVTNGTRPAWLADRVPGFLHSPSLHSVLNVVALIMIWTTVAPVARSVKDDGLVGLQPLAPDWIDRSLFNVATGRESFDDYLSTRRQGYALYRYIAVHDLRTVFQPFDNGAVNYVAAYNGGRDGNWILKYRDLPKDKNDVANFIKGTNIRYFILRKELLPIEVERFGQPHVDMAMAVFDVLLPQAVLLTTDAFGWSLYQVAASSAQK